MTAHSMNITAQGIIGALLPATRQRTVDELRILRDMPSLKARETMPIRVVLELKRARGDADCESFKAIGNLFNSRLSATCFGARAAIQANLNNSASRKAFVADITAVLEGAA